MIAGIIGGIVVGGLSASSVGVSGPAAGLAVIVLPAIHSLRSFETFLLAVVLAGALQIALGIGRAGVLGYFFPSAAIKGMLAGISHVIIDKSNTVAISHDVSEIIQDFVSSSAHRNILVETIESSNGTRRDHGPAVLQPS